MDDLRVRFAALDRLPVPDLWSEVEQRLAAPMPTVRARGPVHVRQQPRWATGSSLRTAQLLGGALAVALLAGTLALAGLGQRPTSAPTTEPSKSSLPSPLAPSPTGPQTAGVAWVVVPSLNVPRDGGVRAVLLRGGNVLLAGGHASGGGADDGAARDAELFDPVAVAWQTTGTLLAARRDGHTETLLPDGRVLVAGGSAYQRPGGGPGPRDEAELYDPSTGTWTATQPMSVARSYQLAALLADGRVIVVGGFRPDIEPLATAEVFDPRSGSWSAAGSAPTIRRAKAIAVRQDGMVAVIGDGADGTPAAATFDPRSGTWLADGTLADGDCASHLVGLPDGRLLVLCGTIYDTDPLSAEIVDPILGTRTTLPPPPRRWITMVALSDGRVLVSDPGAGQILEPMRASWAPAGLPSYAGSGPALFRITGDDDNGMFYETDTATLLRDGRVLMTVGTAAFLYDPAMAPR